MKNELLPKAKALQVNASRISLLADYLVENLEADKPDMELYQLQVGGIIEILDDLIKDLK